VQKGLDELFRLMVARTLLTRGEANDYRRRM